MWADTFTYTFDNAPESVIYGRYKLFYRVPSSVRRFRGAVRRNGAAQFPHVSISVVAEMSGEEVIGQQSPRHLPPLLLQVHLDQRGDATGMLQLSAGGLQFLGARVHDAFEGRERRQTRLSSAHDE